MLYTALQILDGTYKLKNGDNKNGIIGLERINIFVGQNNSGKSRFMRSLLDKNIECRLDKIFDLDTWNNYVSQVTNLSSIYHKAHSSDHEFTQIFQSIQGKDVSLLRNDVNQHIGEFKSAFDNITSIVNAFNGPGMTWAHKLEFYKQYQPIKGTLTENFFDIPICNFKRIYIPILRGLKNPFPEEKTDVNELFGMTTTTIKDAGDVFQRRTIGDYWNNEDVKNLDFEIFTGLTLYKEIKKMLLGSPKDRFAIRAFELFLSKRFFNKEQITITPNTEDDVLYVSIGDTEKAIYDLGDGIQSIIILTFPLFQNQNKNILLCIEEPEVGIHPGMQRILLETLAEGISGQKGEHQVFMTTHSNHLLDIGLDKSITDKISIYQFSDTKEQIKNGEGDILGTKKEIINTTRNKNILNLLGVRNSSVFLSNCIVWVEGVSDRIYIKKWLNLYMKMPGVKNFDEDKHYSIVEYGGGNITHFNFGPAEEDVEEINIEGINKSNFVVADNDKIIDYLDESLDPPNLNDTKKKRLRLRNYHKQLILEDGTVNFYAETPEIENLISYSQYKNYFEKFEGRNWQIKSGIQDEERYLTKITKEDIGVVLKSVFIEIKPGKVSDTFSKGKDISIIGDKPKIAYRLTEDMTSFDDLSDGAKELTLRLYKFIESNNP